MSAAQPVPPAHGDDRADALSRVARAIGGSLELGDVFARVAEAARLVVPFDGAGVTLVVDRETVRVYAVSGDLPRTDDAGRLAARGDYSPRLWPADDGRTSRIGDAREELDPAHAVDARILADGFRSVLRVPLVSQGDLLGFQWFVSRQPRAFTDEHEGAVRPIADLVTLALEHERLFRAERERRRRREILDALLPAVAQALDVRDVLRQISEVAQRVLPHDFVLLALLSPDLSSVQVHAMSNGAVNTPAFPLTPETARSYMVDSIVVRDIELFPGNPPRARFHAENAPGGLGYLDTDLHPAQFELLKTNQPRSQIRVPLRRDGKIVGGLVVASRTPDRFEDADVDVARRIADVIELAMAHQRLAEEMKRAAEERGRAERLERSVALLREELESRSPHRALGDSPSWKHALSQAAKVAAVETTVLIQGESGTGKEVLARFVHRASPRKDGPFAALNCAALPENLLESELFGYERGAFTGALNAKPGRIEQAAGGVLFLDEVGETSPIVQAKLLRVLQEREFQRLGGTKVIKADVRILAATNRDLRSAMARGEFREDLYYRLGVFEIRLPPLRERKEDILPLASAFLEEIGHAIGRPSAGLSEECRERLLSHAWPGNVRELRNAIERAAILCEGGLVTSEHLPLGMQPPPPAAASADVIGAAFPRGGVDLEALEKDLVIRALSESKNNKSKAARLLNLTRGQLYNRLEKYGLQ
jgi:two-component system NtrC family response regulator